MRSGSGDHSSISVSGLAARVGRRAHRDSRSSDGALIATASEASTKVWDAATGEEVFGYTPGSSTDIAVTDIAWSPDGSLLAVSGSPDDGITATLDRSGHIVGQVSEEDGFYARSAAFSPDGAWLATSRDVVPGATRSGVYGVTIWDWRTGQAVRTLKEAFGDGLAFAPDGSKLATSEPAIWDPRTGERLVHLTGNTGLVRGVAFSPDGATVATAGDDGTIRLWDAESGVRRLTLHGHGGSANAVAFSPDGTKLASTAADGVVRVWALDLDDLLRIARQSVTRDLTRAEYRIALEVTRIPEK